MATYLRDTGITKTLGGFSITGLISCDMGETYETVYHPAVFPSLFAAKLFQKKIAHKPVDLSFWIITGAPNSSYSLQREPSENPAFYSPLIKITSRESPYEKAFHRV